MTAVGVILYGPPAAGKDTVTQVLHERDRRFRQFRRLKAGPGRTVGYRMITHEALSAMPPSEVLWRNERYGAVFVVDAPTLTQQLDVGVPVLHLGQPAAVAHLLSTVTGARWFVVGLWCPADVAAGRLRARGSADVAQRMAVWSETPSLPPPVSTINTADYSADAVAALVLDGVDHARKTDARG